jgi:hypothetical protein
MAERQIQLGEKGLDWATHGGIDVGGTERPTILTKYFETKLAIVEVNEGETQEEAWRRYLTTHPGHANARVKIFHYPAEVIPGSNKGPVISPAMPAGRKRKTCLT